MKRNVFARLSITSDISSYTLGRLQLTVFYSILKFIPFISKPTENTKCLCGCVTFSVKQFTRMALSLNNEKTKITDIITLETCLLFCVVPFHQ